MLGACIGIDTCMALARIDHLAEDERTNTTVLRILTRAALGNRWYSVDVSGQAKDFLLQCLTLMLIISGAVGLPAASEASQLHRGVRLSQGSIDCLLHGLPLAVILLAHASITSTTCVETLALLGRMANPCAVRSVLHADAMLMLRGVLGQDLPTRARLLRVTERTIALLLLLLLLHDVLQQPMPSVACNRHIAVPLKLSVVAFRFLRYAVPEEATR